jgi:tetratricopeptide (TPR) repeat protein
MAKQESQEEALFDRLAALRNEASRIKFLSRHRMLSRSVVERLDAAVSIQVRVDLHKARELAEAAISVANKLGDKESQAYALRSKGNALWCLGQNRSATELHARAIDLFQEAGKPIEAGRTLSSSIQPLIMLGEYDRAHTAAEHARKIFLAAGDTLRLARLEINVGNLFHRQDRHSEALDRYERAYSQLLPDKDAEGIIAALHNIAVCRIILNDYANALNAYERAREFCLGRNNAPGAGTSGLQHCLSVLPSWKLWALHRNVARGLRDQPECRRCLSRGALSPRSFRDLFGT